MKHLLKNIISFLVGKTISYNEMKAKGLTILQSNI